MMVWWGAILEMVGGLAVFLFGMRTLTTHLQEAAGNFLSQGLKKAARNRLSGLSVGVVLGFGIQSGPASVMLVGFTHAGLLSLMSAAPVVFGFNVGTTLAMQVIAFRITEFWPVPLAVGFLLTLLGGEDRVKHSGSALAGFGLLLLGLGTMTGSLAVLREPLTPWLAEIHSETAGAVLLGIVAGAAVTGLLFSSAASIGMCLALAASGVFTDLRQVYPILLGAQLGTCLTSLLAAANANITGKRTALLHVGFNGVNVALGLLLMGWLPELMEKTAPGDLARQIANLHTALRVTTAVALLPFARQAVHVVLRLTHRAGGAPELSRLEEADLQRPEQALQNAVSECRRLSSLCTEGLRRNRNLMGRWEGREARSIVADEAVMDRMKPAFQDYLSRVSRRELSHRQAVLVTALNRCIISLERIQDHIEHLCELIQHAHRDRLVELATPDREELMKLFSMAIRSLEAVEASFDSEHRKQDFNRMAEEIHSLVEEYEGFNRSCRAYFAERAWRKGHGMQPLQGLFVDACANDLEEIVQHASNIATAESRSEFFLKPRKLSRFSPPLDL